MRTEMTLESKQSLGGDRDRGHGGLDELKRGKPGSRKASEEPPRPGRRCSCRGSGSARGPAARLELLGLISTN